MCVWALEALIISYQFDAFSFIVFRDILQVENVGIGVSYALETCSGVYNDC